MIYRCSIGIIASLCNGASMYQLMIYVCARYDLYIQCACCMDSTNGKLTELVEFVRHSSCTRG
jgi:hypothetical protein